MHQSQSNTFHQLLNMFATLIRIVVNPTQTTIPNGLFVFGIQHVVADDFVELFERQLQQLGTIQSDFVEISQHEHSCLILEIMLE